MRIALLAPPWIPVPPPGYGGIEFMLALLCDALVERGHHVELFCAPGSHSKARVTSLLAAPHPEAIERALFEADHVSQAFDLIDAAAGDGTPYALHGSKGGLVCISHSQAGSAPDGANVVGVVHNPVDVHSWPTGEDKAESLLWVGRIVPEKGPQRAIRVARAAGRPLVLAGNVQPRYERFFAEEIRPHIDGRMVRYVGEVGGVRKQQLFANASAFLMPITWPEPFGLVMVEALAAGTPVLAFAHGAAPEIIEHGRNGFLVDDEDEMAAMVTSARELDPRDCRRSAEQFAPDRVAAAYEAVYDRARGANVRLLMKAG